MHVGTGNVPVFTTFMLPCILIFTHYFFKYIFFVFLRVLKIKKEMPQ